MIRVNGADVARQRIANPPRTSAPPRPADPPPPAPTPPPATAAAPAIPLAGDLVAELTRRLGVDQAAAWVAAKIGVDCGCPQRQELLNRLDAKLRRWFGMLVPGTEVSGPPTKE